MTKKYCCSCGCYSNIKYYYDCLAYFCSVCYKEHIKLAIKYNSQDNKYFDYPEN